jgi:hypothetical protein
VKTFLLVVLVGCAHAVPAPVAALKPVGPRAASLAFYVGSWSCSVTDETGAVAKDYPRLEVVVAPSYANWLSIEVWGKGAKLTSELKGVDDKGVFHHVWTADDGEYGSLTEEDHPAAGSKTRMTFTKLDDTHYTHLAEVDTGAGWKTDFQKTCRKV